MGLLSEIHAEMNAKFLEMVILNAMHNPEYGDHRSAILGFVKKELVEQYYEECSETLGSFKPNSEILEKFPPKKE